MHIRPIRTSEDYDAALKMIDKYWLIDENTEDYDNFEVLCLLIEDYEKRTKPIDLPDPIEALKYFMHQDGASQEELGLLLKDQVLAKMILEKSAPLTTFVLYKLYKEWDYPAVPLLKPYKLVSDPLEPRKQR